jgi:hypothetical protein
MEDDVGLFAADPVEIFSVPLSHFCHNVVHLHLDDVREEVTISAAYLASDDAALLGESPAEEDSASSSATSSSSSSTSSALPSALTAAWDKFFRPDALGRSLHYQLLVRDGQVQQLLHRRAERTQAALFIEHVLPLALPSSGSTSTSSTVVDEKWWRFELPAEYLSVIESLVSSSSSSSSSEMDHTFLTTCIGRIRSTPSGLLVATSPPVASHFQAKLSSQASSTSSSSSSSSSSSDPLLEIPCTRRHPADLDGLVDFEVHLLFAPSSIATNSSNSGKDAVESETNAHSSHRFVGQWPRFFRLPVCRLQAASVSEVALLSHAQNLWRQNQRAQQAARFERLMGKS